jgi:hypothetical protein
MQFSSSMFEYGPRAQPVSYLTGTILSSGFLLLLHIYPVRKVKTAWSLFSMAPSDLIM